MKRFYLITLLIAALAMPAFASPQAQLQRPNVRGAQQNQAQPQNQPDPEVRRQNQVRMIVTDLYVQRFSKALELSDDQFLKVTFFIRSFIENRFMAAMRRDNINRQLEQLQAQPNPSKEDVDNLVVAKAVLDSNVSGMQNQFLNNIRPHLTTQQVLAFLQFNTKFFEEDLRQLIEQARANAPQGRQGAPVRPNQLKQQNNPNRPADALRPNKQNDD